MRGIQVDFGLTEKHHFTAKAGRLPILVSATRTYCTNFKLNEGILRSMLLNMRLNTRASVLQWNDVNWHQIEQNVKKLQCRIAKAVKEHKPLRIIKGLMNLLKTSLSARLLAKTAE